MVAGLRYMVATTQSGSLLLLSRVLRARALQQLSAERGVCSRKAVEGEVSSTKVLRVRRGGVVFVLTKKTELFFSECILKF